MNLVELQHAFKNYVLHDDDGLVHHVTASESLPGELRLGVYRDAYQARLTQALASNYPRLQQLLGTQPFGSLSRAYLATHPSHAASVRWFGDRLPHYLGRLTRYAARPWLAELAHWEWAIAAAFDAADAAPLPPSALHRIAPAAWATLRFGIHPSAQRLQLQTNAAALFKALTQETEWPTPQTLEQPQDWLIWRQDLTPKYRSLAPDEARAFDLVCSHANFGEICEALREWHEPDQIPAHAASLLRRWLSDQVLTRMLYDTVGAQDTAMD